MRQQLEQHHIEKGNCVGFDPLAISVQFHTLPDRKKGE